MKIKLIDQYSFLSAMIHDWDYSNEIFWYRSRFSLAASFRLMTAMPHVYKPHTYECWRWQTFTT